MQKVIDTINKTDTLKVKKIDFSRKILKIQRKIKTKSNLKKGLYEDWKAEILSRSEFIEIKMTLDDEIQSLENSIKKLRTEEQTLIDMETQNIKWMNRFINNYDLKELSRELLSSLIDKIYIDANKNIYIQFKYQDEYSRIIKYVTNEINGNIEDSNNEKLGTKIANIS